MHSPNIIRTEGALLEMHKFCAARMTYWRDFKIQGGVIHTK